MASKSNKHLKRLSSKRNRTRTGGPQPSRSAAKATVESGQEDSSDQPESMAIPEHVSRRMIGRVVVFSGLPTLLGLSSFGLNYVLLTQGIWQLPPYLTLAESLAFFALGFLGISYGVLSASWDDEPGSRLGWQEFRVNLGRVIQQWRERQEKS
ncbi:MAG: DUF3464 family protein [Synechococcaceae cyanobacterium SM2_3_1]|nr:DUF3464 family protein [Synechococcaceae cyanobacterium SM2_3_1]